MPSAFEGYVCIASAPESQVARHLRRDLQILMLNGTTDRMVPIDVARRQAALARERVQTLRSKELDGDHFFLLEKREDTFDVIKSFGDRDTERLFQRLPARKLAAGVQRVALRKLRILDAATVLDDLRVPLGNRLERLKGDRKGQYSIRINRQWRVCFRWRSGDAYDVEIVDCH